MNNMSKRIIALLLSAVILVSLASCGGKVEPKPSESLPSSEQEVENEGVREGFFFINPLRVPSGADFVGRAPLLTTTVQDKKDLNSDTVGWLQVPNTDIDDVVVFYPGDRNEYYLRRNFEKRYSWNGIYFADYRSKFDGTANGFSKNTVIYGHNLDKAENENAIMFAQLLRFRSETFAKETPYIYFSTEREDFVWEVFAVFYATVDLPYNHPNPNEKDYAELISESRKRSLYNYDVQVGANDKIITLSTCTYKFTSAYPNNYRYVIMAKLVSSEEVLKQQAAFEVNPSPKAP